MVNLPMDRIGDWVEGGKVEISEWLGLKEIPYALNSIPVLNLA
jgi:hypothetical protein